MKIQAARLEETRLAHFCREYASEDVALAKWLHWKAIRDRSKPDKRLKRVVFREPLFSLATRDKRGGRREDVNNAWIESTRGKSSFSFKTDFSLLHLVVSSRFFLFRQYVSRIKEISRKMVPRKYLFTNNCLSNSFFFLASSLLSSKRRIILKVWNGHFSNEFR